MKGQIKTKKYLVYPNGDVYTKEFKYVKAILNHDNLSFLSKIRNKDKADALIEGDESLIAKSRLDSSIMHRGDKELEVERERMNTLPEERFIPVHKTISGVGVQE